MLCSGGLGHTLSGAHDLTFAQFNADPATADNASVLNTAFTAAAANGRPIEGQIGTYTHDSALTVPAGLQVRGAPYGTTRLNKNFTTTGSTNAGIVSANLTTTGSDNVSFERIEIGAVAHKILGVEVNKPLLLRGSKIVLRNVYFNTWSGWAFLGFGDVEVADCRLNDGLNELGVDGFHYGGGTRFVIHGCTGTAPDDFIAVLTPLTGDAALMNQDILSAHVHDNVGVSLNARGLAVGVWDSGLSSDCTNFLVEDNEFTGNAVTGSVYCPSLSATGNVQGAFKRNTIHGNTSLSAMSIRGSAGSLNVTSEDDVMDAGTDHVLQILGRFDSIVFTGASLDGTGCSSHAINVPTAAGSTGFSFTGSVVCGAGRGINLASGTSVLNAPDVTATVTEVPNGNAALHMNAVEDGRFTIHATKTAGATTSIGIKEGGLSARNLFENGTLTGVDTAVSTPAATSTYTNNAGYP